MTTTWVEAAMTRVREALPRLQRELDEERARLDELRARQAALERPAGMGDPRNERDPRVGRTTRGCGTHTAAVSGCQRRASATALPHQLLGCVGEM